MQTSDLIELPIGYMHDHCDNWEGLCDDLGISSDCLVYGYYEPDDRLKIELAVARRHGLVQ